MFTEETAGRARSMLATRRKAAGFPTGKTFDAWDPAASSIPAPTQQALRTLEWITRRENLVVCGPSGTGKTFFLEASDSRPSKPACAWPGSDSRTSAP
ncbi:ATP-binding protein [Arthrobacter nitrophenolicus]|uniref:ATP-binding protein n=1 Tax=Arthrobacter nitrophenolicus TaxID=683150 RepID=UPI0023B88409|nr:ATP-binding protein [Arthrobacter nitrophenolicus]